MVNATAENTFTHYNALRWLAPAGGIHPRRRANRRPDNRDRPPLPAPATPSDGGPGTASNAAPAIAILPALRQDGSRSRSQKQDLSGSRKSGSQWTRRWREMDSNHRSLAKSRGSRQLNILQILAGRLSGYPTVGRCGDVRFRALVKGSMAWLLCLAVGQASSLASSCCSTLFLLTRPFGEGPTVRIRFPPAASPLRT